MIYLGYIASVLITVAYIPQVWNCYKSGKQGVSNHTLAILIVAMLCWIIYSQSIGDIPLCVSSSMSVCQLLYLAIYPSYVKNYKKRAIT